MTTNKKATTAGRAILNTRSNLTPKAEAWEWQERGNCATLNSEIFFLDGGERMGVKARKEAKAKAVCVGCPVINECLSHALAVPERFGVWGGTTPEERLSLQLNNNLIITNPTNTIKEQ